MSNVSKLGHNIDRLGSMLRKTASSQIEDYQNRFSSMANLYDTVFKDLIIDKYDTQQACITARKLLGKDTVNFVAIDGTEYSKPMFDMVIFYAGAYSCEGSMTKDYSVIIYIIINFTLSKVKATAFESLD